MIAGIFQEVEDRHGGVLPPHPDRLYPPVEDMEREVEGMPSLRRYRHTNHYTLIADSGAILIRGFIRGEVNGIRKITGERTILDKPGADGVHIPSGE